MQNRNEISLVNNDNIEAAISFCIDRKIQGDSYDNILETISFLYKINDKNIADHIIHEADSILSKASIINFEDILYSHIHTYEQLYSLFLRLNDEDGVLKTLKQKEVLLGLSSDYEELKQSISKTMEERKGSDYDLTKLTEEEFIRFNELKQKMETYE